MQLSLRTADLRGGPVEIPTGTSLGIGAYHDGRCPHLPWPPCRSRCARQRVPLQVMAGGEKPEATAVFRAAEVVRPAQPPAKGGFYRYHVENVALAPKPAARPPDLTTTRAPFIEEARAHGDIYIIDQPYEL